MLEEGAATAAAEQYVRSKLLSFPFPTSPNQFQLLMEIAFIEGAQWYNEKLTESKQSELDALEKEVANAR